MRKKLLILTAVLVVGLVMLPAAVAQTDYCKCGTPKCKYEHDRHQLPHLNPEMQPLMPQKAPASNGQRADWEFMGPEGGTFAAVATDPTNADVATVLGSGTSIYTTADGGASWTYVDQAPQYIYDFAAFDGDRFYIVGYDPDDYQYKVGITDDRGVTWTQFEFDPSTGTPYAVAAHPTDPNIIYMGSYVYNPSGPHLYSPWLHVTTDGGATWTATDLSAYATIVPFGMAVSANDPNIMYMAGYDYDISTYIITGMCLASTDGGATWTAAAVSPNGTEYPTMVAIDPADDNHVFAPGTHIFESFDGGATWSTNAYGLAYCYGIDFDPTNSAHILIAAEAGVLRSTDGGVNWTVVDIGGGMPQHPVFNQGTPSTIYCACYYSGITKSIDSGATWDNVCNGILESRVYGVEVGLSSPNRIYSSPYGFAAFQRSEDSGETWTEINIPPEGTYVFVALENSNNPDNILVVLPGG